MSLTRADVLVAITHLEDEVHAWEASRDETLKVGYEGREVKALNSAVETAAIALFELCDRVDIEEEAWSLVRAIDALDDAFAAFAAQAKTPGARVHPGGTREMWGSYGEVLRARLPMRWHRPTPLKQMIGKINPDQIAKEYHWLREYGRDRALEMIQEELERPGTHYNAETWVHPREQEFLAEIRTWWDGRVSKIKTATRAVQAHREKAPKKDAPETLDYLIQTGTRIDQILKMKPSISRDEVQQRAVELGIALDDETIGHVSYRQAQAAREMREARSRQAALEVELKQQLNTKQAGEQNTYVEFGDDLEGRVLRMAEDGLRPGKIAESLRHLPNPPTAAMIGRIIRVHSTPVGQGQAQ